MEASKALKQASDVMMSSPAALQVLSQAFNTMYFKYVEFA